MATSTISAQPMTSPTFLDLVKSRRSIYALAGESTISDARIQEIVQEVVYNAPSPFNAQSCRTLILVKGEHRNLWDLAIEAFKLTVSPQVFASFEGKLNNLKNAYGSVLFFEDPDAFKECETRMGPRWALVKDKCPERSEQSNAMQQFAVWAAFVAEGLACNLQRYNPLVDSRVQKTWNIPETWSLRAQLVFGKPNGGPNEKTFKPVVERVLFHSS